MSARVRYRRDFWASPPRFLRLRFLLPRSLRPSALNFPSAKSRPRVQGSGVRGQEPVVRSRASGVCCLRRELLCLSLQTPQSAIRNSPPPLLPTPDLLLPLPSPPSLASSSPKKTASPTAPAR